MPSNEDKQEYRESPLDSSWCFPPFSSWAPMVYPLCNLLYLSLHDYSPLRSGKLLWVGLRNYIVTLLDPATRASLWTTLVFTVGSIFLEVAIGLLVAVLLARVTTRYQGRLGSLMGRAFSGGFILPFAIPAVTAAVVWKIMLDPQIGPVDTLLQSQIPWFSDYPLWTIIVVDAWKTMPFVMFLLYAAIVSIEPSQFEAAEIDGANSWQIFLHLTLPAILPVLTVTAAFRAVDAFTKAFDIILATTAGGPGQASMVFPFLFGVRPLSACSAAYGLSRYPFPGSGLLLSCILLLRLITPASLVLPLYLMMNSLRLANTLAAVAIGITILNLPTASHRFRFIRAA
jgi:ABC-type sugar transport system permease subunit